MRGTREADKLLKPGEISGLENFRELKFSILIILNGNEDEDSDCVFIIECRSNGHKLYFTVLKIIL